MRYLFEDFALDTDLRELRRQERVVTVEPQVFDLLVYLVRHRARLVTKDDLFRSIWHGRIVSESALTTRINAARAALGDSGHEQRLIRTLRGHGFRFMGDVREPVAAAAEDHISATIPPAILDRPSIAMLPFANLTGDPGQEYFADGMVDDILSALSRVPWLFVIARQSSFVYKTRAADMIQVGRELGVRYAVEGTVRKSGTRVRITAQLIDTETGTHIWADRYEGDLRDIFAVQDALTERIAAAIEQNIQAAEIKRARGKPTGSLTAYDLYLRALPAYFGPTSDDYKRTGILLSDALAVDPEYSEALGLLIDVVANSTLQGWNYSWRDGVDEATRLADSAVAVAPGNSTCLASAAFTYGVLSQRFDEAFELTNRAVALHPNSLLVRTRAGAVYAVCGEHDQAIAQCEAADRLNPLASRKGVTFTSATLSSALYFAGRYEECIDAGKRAMALAPLAIIPRKYVALSLAQLGRTDEARTEMAELVRRQPGASIALFSQQGFRHKWMREKHVEGLRKAGLREE